MKRSVFILSLAAFVLSSNAQVLKSNLLNGYKQGDKLEKATYNKADAPIKIDTCVKHSLPKLTRMPVVPLPDKSSVMRDIRKKEYLSK